LTSKGRSGRILCGINLERFDVLQVAEHEFAISAEVVDKKTRGHVRLIIVYGPAQDDRKEQFLIELSNICAQNKLPPTSGGDFNILRFSSEKNKNFTANRFSDMFNWIINSYELREIVMNGGKFTWSNNQMNPTLEKLDRVLMNNDWETIYPLTTLRKIPRLMSDHNPLMLCTEQEKIKKRQECFPLRLPG
jgi:hypothetical protein